MHEVSTETTRTTNQTSRGARTLCATLALSALFPASSLASVGQDLGLLRDQAGEWLKTTAEHAYSGSRARVEMGSYDDRLSLPPCQSVAFALPAGGHAWGRGSVEVRCNAPKPWRVYLGFQIRLNGPVLVARHALAARQPVRSADLEPARIDYVRAPEAYPRELPTEALASRPLAAGQPVTLDNLVLPQIVQAGREVRVLVNGRGFNLSQQGTALASGSAGQVIKVRTTSGRIVQGVIRNEGMVEIEP